MRSTLFVLLFTLGIPYLSHARSAPTPKAQWTYVEKRLKAEGFRKDFIRALKTSYETDDFIQVLELNTLLFLRKSDYHGVQVTGDAARDVSEFVKANRESLTQAQKAHGVNGEVIASLLWLESRYGTNTGAFHVPSVFADLLQVDRPEVVKHLYRAAHKFTNHVGNKVRSEIDIRVRRRAKWAVAELKAIQKMYRSNREVLNGFNGSFAGAFGMPQFIPSSFNAYAKSATKGQMANLNLAEDAIHSVAHYLKRSGWKQERQKTHENALFKYNNSRDYAQAILKLAQQARELDGDHERREPASTGAVGPKPLNEVEP